MLKQQVLDLIAANLATGSDITAAEHRAVEQAIVDYVGFDVVAAGRIGPINIADGTTNYSVTGNLTSAIRTYIFEKYTVVEVTIPSGLLSSTNFKVRVDVESSGSDGNLDNDMLGVLFRKNGSSTTTFNLIIEEINAGTINGSIYVHVEVVQL
jgi:hypothetical protein